VSELVLGTRGSALARTQSEWVADKLRALGHDVRLEIIVTRGDTEQDRPVPELGGKGLFTAELEQALLDGRIHLAVHSMKDLPTEDTAGLKVGAVPAREDFRDAVVGSMHDGARVGTASLRRRALLQAARPDLEIVPMRGNVDTRISKVASGEVDAVILAAAGLKRLGRADVIDDYLDILPAPAQGALAVQTSVDGVGADAVAALHDEETERDVQAERTLLAVLEGGCSVPVGALARHGRLRGCVAAIDGSLVIVAEAVDDDPVALGNEVARKLLEQGAREILDG
jgi:hydroxymethylbilane synthase